MASLGKIARRTFLVGSAAIAGGVAFGVYTVRTPYENPNLADLAPGEASFNPWVRIDAEKITLIGPHAELGQGVQTVQAALIAEEMDLAWGQFETSYGTPDKAYWNTVFGSEGAPFKPTDESFTAEATRSAMTGLIKLLGVQGTGGSSTVPDSYDKLRAAGASARETLKLAAANRTGTPAAQLTTEAGHVILPDGTRIPYTDLAAEAATLEPVQDVPLRDPSTWKLLGKPIERLDMVAKSTGTQSYGIDLTRPGMVHATVKTNPRKTALRSYDATEAETMRGVQAVLPITNGVAVIADNTWRAFAAAEAISFDWAPADYPAEQAAHWATLETSFTDDHLDREWRNDGDVETALTGAETMEAEYRSPYVAHAPLEPLNALMVVTDDAVDVWTSHQLPRQLQVIVAGITGHDPEQVIFHNQQAGGSFGHRLEFEHIKQTAEIANQLRGTPVKMTLRREEDFAQDFPRHIAMARARGTVREGRIDAVDLSIAAPSVMASQLTRAGLPAMGPDMQLAAGAWNNPYALPHYRMRAYRAEGLAPTSSWRAVGAPAAGFFFDSFIDELCHKAGADPMEERIRLMDHAPSRRVLEEVARMSNWGETLPEGTAKGVAFVESFGVPTAEVVQVTDTPDGIRIDKVWIAADVGRVLDPVNFENQMQGGVVFGLGHAMNCEITYADGIAEQENYYAHEGMRLHQCPEIFVEGLENQDQIRGIGEPPVPPAAPALANAIFAATGQRLREMPFNKFVDFV